MAVSVLNYVHVLQRTVKVYQVLPQVEDLGLLAWRIAFHHHFDRAAQDAFRAGGWRRNAAFAAGAHC